jgi:hypothetical protein
MPKKGPEINWEDPSKKPILRWLSSNYEKFTYKELSRFMGIKENQVRYAIQQVLGLRKTVNSGQFQYVQVESDQFYVSFRRRTKDSLEGSWFIKSTKGGKMELLSHYNWRKAGHGEVPKKYMLRFIKGDDLSSPEVCRVENLELVSYADHMRMNRRDNREPSGVAKSRLEYQRQRREKKRLELEAQGIVVKRGKPKLTPEQKEASRLRRLQKNKEWRERNIEKVREHYRNASREARAAGKKKGRKPLTPEQQAIREERRAQQLREKQELQKLKIEQRQARMAPGRKNRSQRFQPKMETKQVDYSQMKLVQVDRRTAIYIPKDQDTREAIELYHKKRAAV